LPLLSGRGLLQDSNEIPNYAATATTTPTGAGQPLICTTLLDFFCAVLADAVNLQQQRIPASYT